MSDHKLDFARECRTGVPEAILGSGKSAAQVASIVETVLSADERMLITRLDADKARALERFGAKVRYDALSGTAEVGAPRIVSSTPSVAVVAAGTSDIPVGQQAVRTLAFFGESATLFADIGVAGLWRLSERLEEIRQYPVIIAIAGMEGALFSVLAGLVRAPVIAVPTSVGYGVSEGGNVALSSALASCAPGVLVVNIDNGFGAAAAAMKILNVGRR